MGLFDIIQAAIADPDKEANPNQLATIINTVQQLSSSTQTDPTAVQSAMAIVGNYTRSALQQKRDTEGEGQVEEIINQFAGIQPNNQVVNMLFSTPMIQQMVGEIGGKTGMNPALVQTMLPQLVPLVLNFLKTGSGSLGSNPVLKAFLDSDGDGDVDMADLMNLASKYLR